MPRTRGEAPLRAATRILLIGALCAAALAHAQAPGKPAASDGPRFEVRSYVFDGATLVPRARLEAVTRPYTGTNRTFADVQRALEAIERLYSESGYSAVQVVLPEQDLDRGSIRFQITEARVGRVLVEGNKFFSEENIRASVPSLAPGRAPNIDEIARNLRVANESPAKQATVLLRSGQEEATVDAVVRVTDEKATRYSFTADNTGTKETGRARVGLGFQNADTFGGDQVLTMQYVTAPYSDEVNSAGEPDRLSLIPSRKVTIIGAGLRIPFYEWGDSLDLSAGYSDVNSGVVQGIFSITGAGSIAGARYTRNFDKIGDYEHRMLFSADYRAYDNSGVRTVDGTEQLIPDVTVHPLTLSYVGTNRAQDSELSFSVGYSKNFAGGNDGDMGTFCASRSNGLGDCADGNYEIYRWSWSITTALRGDFQMRLGMNGQYTRDMLVTGEQFGIGGMDSVRGFNEREVTNDYGFRGTLEFYGPDIAPAKSDWRARLVGFTDWGAVSRNNPAPAESAQQSIGSLGFGLRAARGNSISFRLDAAWVVDAGGQQSKRDSRVHGSFSWVF